MKLSIALFSSTIPFLALISYCHDLNNLFKFSKFVVLGDSWSDSGNFYHLLNKAFPPINNFRQRCSNGPLWTDVIHQHLGEEVEMVNFAYTNATSSNKMFYNRVPGAVEQSQSVIRYLTGHFPDKETRSSILTSFWFGGAEYQFGLIPPDIVVENFKSSIKLLIEGGLKFFILPTSFVAYKTPQMLMVSPRSSRVYSFVFRLHLILFRRMVKDLKKEYPGVKFYNTEFEDFFDYLKSTPPPELQDKGGYNLTSACIFYEPTVWECSDSHDYFYWDKAHGSKLIQRAMGLYFINHHLPTTHRIYYTQSQSYYIEKSLLDLMNEDMICFNEPIANHHVIEKDKHLYSNHHLISKFTLSILKNEYND